MDEQILLTKEKYQEIKEKLHYLKHVKRKDLNDAWYKAVQEGDDRETDALTVTLKLLKDLELEVIEIENLLLSSKIMKKRRRKKSSVGLGDTVAIELNRKKVTYTIVHPEEADPVHGKISSQSLIGASMLRKKKGAKISFINEAGTQVNILIKKIS